MNPPRPSRRAFLGRGGALTLGAVLGPALVGRRPQLAAEPRRDPPSPRPRPPTLVAVFLRGGADALNILVPWADKTYYEVRPSISIPAETTADEPGVIKLDAKVGLHPAMAALKPLWDRKQLAAIVNAGSPHPTRSHFDAQDFMEYAAPGDRSVHDGWLNRYLAATRDQGRDPLRALAMQAYLPRSLRGREPVLAVPQLRQGDSEGLLDLFDDVYKSGGEGGDLVGGGRMEGGAGAGRDEAVAVGRHTIETLRRFWDVIAKDPPGGQAAYPKQPFAERLRLISRVIRNDAGLQIAALDYPGWDHHQGEGSSDGAIQRDVQGLSDGLGAFAADLGPALDRVLILVMTEFGRTVAENGNRGTDHGRGGVMLALGGPVAGGKIYGDYGRLEPKHLADGRDLRVEIDFRTVFTEALEGLFGFKPPKGFFPLFAGKEGLGIIKKI